MYFNDIIKTGLENQKFTSRYIITNLDGFKTPVFIALSTDKNHNMDLKIYETDMYGVKDYIKPFIENPFHKESVIDSVLFGSAIDGDNPNPRPICQLHTRVWNESVSLTDICTREDVRRKGLASYALKIVQDYYSRNKETKAVMARFGGDPILFASKHGADTSLKYETRFEHNAGAFGKLVGNVMNKVMHREAKDAYKHFLVRNHFSFEDNTYQLPCRPMYARDILSDEIINEDTAANHIQIFDGVVEYDPKESVRDNIR